MKFDKFLDKINTINFSELPGQEAHLIAMPKFNNLPYRTMKPREDSLQSAVMMLFLRDEDDDTALVLTIRSENLGSHSGQISFPGGRLEPGEKPLDAAYRETYEEIGVRPEQIKLIAQLSDFFVIPSNSIVKPFIGIVDKIPDFVINEDEVQEIILVKLDYLLDNQNLINEEWEFKEFRAIVPHWKVHKEKNLWGATAMMLCELLELIHKN